MKKLFFAVVLCIMMTLCFSSCKIGCINTNRYNIDNFKKLLEAGEYMQAAEMYINTADGNVRREKEAERALSDFVRDAINSYLNGEADYKEAQFCFETAQQTAVCSGVEFWRVRELERRLSDANNSKIAYYSGKVLMETGNYLAAISEFEKVIEADINYPEAQAALSLAIENMGVHSFESHRHIYWNRIMIKP